MGPDEVDLTLNSRRNILMRGEPLWCRLLQLSHELVGGGDERVDQIFTIDGLEVATVWKRNKETSR